MDTNSDINHLRNSKIQGAAAKPVARQILAENQKIDLKPNKIAAKFLSNVCARQSQNDTLFFF